MPKKNKFSPQRILILDDESDIVDLCVDALQGQYHVVKTCSPFEAVALMDAGRDMIDLVICDYNMPGMNGSEFISEIRSLGVKTPAILYSGKMIDKKPEEFIRVLEKPFSITRLHKEVDSVLSSLKQQEAAFQKFRGILAHLDMAIDSLERVFVYRKVEDFERLEPSSALKRFGPGESYNVFTAWYYLSDLRSRIQGKKRVEHTK